MFNNKNLIDLVKITANDLDINNRLCLAVYSMGIPGEINEAIEAYHLGINRQEFKEEIADIVWYTIANSILFDDLSAIYEIDFNTDQLIDFNDGLETLNFALFESLKHLEKAKKYIRDFPKRDLHSLKGYIKPLQIISKVFNLADSYEILDKKLRARYPRNFSR